MREGDRERIRYGNKEITINATVRPRTVKVVCPGCGIVNHRLKRDQGRFFEWGGECWACGTELRDDY